MSFNKVVEANRTRVNNDACVQYVLRLGFLGAIEFLDSRIRNDRLDPELKAFFHACYNIILRNQDKYKQVD